MGVACAAGAQQPMLAASVALSASAAMCLPISTPPNALAHSSGRIRSRHLLLAGGAVGLVTPPLAVGRAWLVLG